MNNLITICAERSRAFVFLLIILIITGYSAYKNIPKESNPDVKVPIIYILVRYDGISAEDAERLLSRPLETALKTIDGVKEITSYSSENSSSIILEFDAGFDNKKALDDVRAKVNDTRIKLPTDTKMPEIHEINLSLEPVINIALNGSIPKRTLIQISREIAKKLEALPDVLSIEIGGDREESVEIVVNPYLMESNNISPLDVFNTVNRNNKLIPAGSIRTPNGTYALKVPSVIQDSQELLDFPIKVDHGQIIKIKDIAQVVSTYKDGMTDARVNNKSAVVLEISKKTGHSIIQTIESIKTVLNEYKELLPKNIEINYIQDKSKKIRDMISELENGLIIGIILVMCIIMVSVGIKPAILIALSLPASFFTCILWLDMMGYTLNVVVLFSLILTVGMIVDDAIVVSEYADRKMTEGMKPHESFIEAAHRMFIPIFTSTLVKILVFMPLLFWPGIIGQFMKFMPITVICILTTSLLFAILMQPAIGPLFGHTQNANQQEIEAMLASENGELEKLQGLTRGYIGLLMKVLDRPKRFLFYIIGFIFLIYISFYFFGKGSEFFPKVDPDSATITIQSPGNLSLEEKDVLVSQVEQKLMHTLHKEVLTYYTKSGDLSKDHNMPKHTIGAIQLDFVDSKYRRKADQILDDAKKAIAGIEGITIQTMQERMGPPSLKPITFNISAIGDINLSNIADKIIAEMKSIKGFKDIEDSRGGAGVDWELKIDRNLAIEHGVNTDALGSMVQMMGSGLIISQYRPDYLDDEVDIVVRFPQDYRSIKQIEQTKIFNSYGALVPINNFVKMHPIIKVDEIKKVDRQKVITISADVERDVLVNDQVAKLKKMFAEKNDDSYRVMFKGDEKDQNETMAFLKNAFLAALMLMFITMLIQFNSYYLALIVMSAVFLSIAGVLLGLLLSLQPFGIVMSGVGIIALSGIVLNNNILLIDTYRRLRLSGIENKKAVLMASAQRVRPIILTAATAILGLLPMVLSLTIDFYHREVLYDQPASALWKQLATSIAGGLSFATVLTLFFTPCLLVLGRKMEGRSRFDFEK